MKTKINFENYKDFSPQKMIIFLSQLIDEEIEKTTENINCDFINKCSNLILLLQGKHPCNMTEEEKARMFKATIDCHKDSNSGDDNDDNIGGDCEKSQSSKEETKKRLPFKKIFLIAALISIISISLTVFVGANEIYKSYNPNIFGIPLKELFKHEVYKEGNITYINQNTDEAKYYCSVEDFSKGENIQGLFFPEELEIKEIMYSEADGNQEIIFNPVDQSGCFCITATTNDMYGISSNLPTYTKDKTEGGTDVWLYEKTNALPETGTLQIMFKINQWYYCIQTSHPESTLKLIDEFKEIIS